MCWSCERYMPTVLTPPLAASLALSLSSLALSLNFCIFSFGHIAALLPQERLTIFGFSHKLLNTFCTLNPFNPQP